MKEKYLGDCMTWRVGVRIRVGPRRRAVKEHEAIPRRRRSQGKDKEQ